ncbi:MAG: PocR ligand-binding domain-containing protein [Pseudomonadota bacterium]
MAESPSYQELLEQIAGMERELAGARQREKVIADQEDKRYRVIFEKSPLGMTRFDPLGTILDCNTKLLEIMGSTREQMIGLNIAGESSPKMQAALKKALAGEFSTYEDAYTSGIGGKTSFLRITFNPVTPGQTPTEVIATVEDITRRRLADEVIARRLLSLTQPLTDASTIAFEDLFNLEDLQLLQDQFAKATGVASIITRTDGTPITRPSNFTRLCSDIIRTSEKGFANCCKSDATLGRLSTDGPSIQPCMSGGLWDAGAGISISGQHIANWLIGQVRDETQTEEKIRQYAHDIGVDEEHVVQAFREVPAMSRHHFEEIAKALFTLANRLSTTAYQNVQQARFITDLKNAQEKLQESENRLRFALQGANDGLWDANLLTGAVYFSERGYEILGHPPGTMAGAIADWRTLIHPDDFPPIWEHIVAHFKKKTPMLRFEVRLRLENGDWKWALVRGKVVEWDKDGRALRITGTLTDIDNRKKFEETQMFLLRCDRSASNEDFFMVLARFLANLLPMDFVCIDKLEGDKLSARTVAIYHDGEFKDNVSYTLQDTPCGNAIGETICSYSHDVRHLFPKDAVLQEMGAESYVGTTLWDSHGKEIGLIAVISRKALETTEHIEAVLKLVAMRAASELERREAEHERAILQTQLMQAQKMESVGRLAGGVAHDFNNMLGVILGHVEIAEEQVNPADPLLHDLQEIKKAATRSADLTRQLLAFARKQTISPKVLDLNETVESLLKMMRRLIGEDIELVWLPGNNLWPVKIDPTQVDQILANLTINARDAIAGVGRVTIETANIVLDDDYCTDHTGFLPGSYVLLTVSDDGCGMDKETCEHAFEPFFTTKDVGQGTGLGLATIYGIIKQNSGFINLYSEPGKGTTFRILLPKHLGKTCLFDQNKPADVVQQGRETILLVEDEPSILLLGKRMLERMGYLVLAAATPGEALETAEHHAGEIHLLLTDVIMPEMNGRDLARRLLSLYPRMARMFMSGYTANVIAHHGVLDEDVQFIQKPFSMVELSSKVRKALRKE